MAKKQGYICILITTVLFSSMEAVLKLIAGDFNPIQITFTRFLVAGVILLPMAAKTLRQRGLKLEKADYIEMAGLGFLGILFSMTFYQLSILYIDASVVAVLFSCNPIFVTVFAILLIGEEAKLNKFIALAVDLVGIVFIIQPWNLHLNILGVIFILVSAAAFALYGVLGKKQCAKLGGIVVTCGGFLFGSVEMMILAALSHIPAVASALSSGVLNNFAAIPFVSGYAVDNLLVVLYVCICCTGIGYTCYFLAMERVSAQTVSMVFFFKPVLAPIMAAVILGEAIHSNMVIGICLILAGSLVSMADDNPLQRLRKERAHHDA